MLLYKAARVKGSGPHPFADAGPPATGVCDSPLNVHVLFPRLRRSRQLLY